jgi:hypothetical protein
MAPKLTGAERVALALEATEVPTGRRNMVDQALDGVDLDEREAWLAVLRDPDIPSQHIARAMKSVGMKVGNTESSVKTWRANQPTG